MTSALLSWLISFSMAFSGQAVITFAVVRMLKITRPGVIWAIAVVSCCITAHVNAFDDPADLRTLWTIVNLLVSVSTYVIFSELRPLRALFVVACVMLVTMLAELVTVLITLHGLDVNITVGPEYALEHPGVYLFLIIFHAVMLGIMLYAASGLTRRVSARDRESGLTRTLLFPISQSVLLVAAMLVVRALANQDERVLVYGALLTVAVSGAYLFFYIAARRMRAQELAVTRVAAEQERAALIHAQTLEMARESQRVAKMRHDFRNQVQVVELLWEQGKTGQAREMAEKLLENVERERVR